MKEQVRKSQFLFPNHKGLPPERVCGQIVHELKKRQWLVPGVVVNFRDYGEEESLRYVDRIQGQNWKLKFGRAQRSKKTLSGGYVDKAGIASITIPKKQLLLLSTDYVYLYLYVGADYLWEDDQEAFMHNSKQEGSKALKEPRTYLAYLLAPETNFDGRPLLLLHTNEEGREYDPQGSEPRKFLFDEVMREFTHYLEDIVLQAVVT